jgi:hypothetical protein
VRSALPGERLLGWLPDARSDSQDFLIASGPARTAVLTVSEGAVSESSLAASAERVAHAAQRTGLRPVEAMELLRQMERGQPDGGADALTADSGASSDWHLPPETLENYFARFPSLAGGREPHRRLELPTDGPLAGPSEMRIERRDSASRFSLKAGASWVQLEPTAEGFARDEVHSVVLTKSGRVLALRGDGLIVPLLPERADGEPSGVMARWSCTRRARRQQDGGLELLSPVLSLPGATKIENAGFGDLRVDYADHSVVWLQELDNGSLERTERPAARRLASVSFGEDVLSWSADASGLISASWESARERNGSAKQWPVWHTGSGKLAIDSPLDLAATPEGLLVSTSVGLLWRDAASFQVKRVWHEYADAHLIAPAGGAGPIIVSPPGATVGETVLVWGGRDIASEPREKVEQRLPAVSAGPWSWHRTLGLPGEPPDAIGEIVHSGDASARRVVETEGAWSFADDVVTWIARGPEDGRMWLATRDGLWPATTALKRIAGASRLLADKELALVEVGPSGIASWKARNGEESTVKLGEFKISPGSPVSASLPGEGYAVANWAVRVSQTAGRLNLAAFDQGGAVFHRGRFFFNNNSDLVASGGGLYTLIENRGVVLRDPSNPAIVRGIWQLPEKRAVRLLASADGPRLETQGPGPAKSWLLDPKAASGSHGAWRPTTRIAPEVFDRFDSISWVRDHPWGKIEPSLQGGEASRAALVSRGIDWWWDRDRFVWDAARCAGAVGDDLIVAATPIGVVALRVVSDGFASVGLRPTQDITSCARAADDAGKTVGVVLRGEDGPSCLLAKMVNGAVAFEETSGPVCVGRRATVVIDDSGENGRLAITERWARPTNSPVQALVVRIPNLACEPICGGQFLFDQGGAATPVALRGTATSVDAHTQTSSEPRQPHIPRGDGVGFMQPWWMVSECGGRQTATCSVVGLNELSAKDGASRLELTRIWANGPTGVTHLRPLGPEKVQVLRRTEDSSTPAWQREEIELKPDQAVRVVEVDQLSSAGPAQPCARSLQGVPAGSLEDHAISMHARDFQDGCQVTLDVPHLQWTARASYPWRHAGARVPEKRYAGIPGDEPPFVVRTSESPQGPQSASDLLASSEALPTRGILYSLIQWLVRRLLSML